MQFPMLYVWIEEPTVFVTRFEYANLYHTVTELYNAYVSSRIVGLPNRPHLVFLDGHCQSPMEEMWEALFSSVTYAKHFTGSSVCFRHGIFSPRGYDTALFQGLSRKINCRGIPSLADNDLSHIPDVEKTARLSEFGEMMRAAFGFLDSKLQVASAGHRTCNILFVRREDYLSHLRQQGQIVSRISNEQGLFNDIKNWADAGTNTTQSGCKLNIVGGSFGHMSMKEQIRAVKDAAVIVGAHGEGLAHIVSALPGTVVLEILASDFLRPHYELIAKWRGLGYHSIHIDGSQYADPQVVIDKLSGILTSIGCYH